MQEKQQNQAVVRVQPFPTLIAQAFQLTEMSANAGVGAEQALATSAVVFAAMSLECAATSCLEFVRIPNGPHGKIDRTLSVIDKFDVLHWLAVGTPLDRGQHIVQKVSDLVAARNALVHARMRREPFGEIRDFAAGEEVEIDFDKTDWNALHIPKEERAWRAEHAKRVMIAAVEFLNYFYFDACKRVPKVVHQMLCTCSGDLVLHTQWETEVLSGAAQRFGLKLRFLDF